MRPLILNNDSRQKLARIRAYAEANVLGRDELLRRIRENDAVGDDRERICVIPVGYRVCLSIEHQPVGLCHHISVSVNKAGAKPNPDAVNMIMEELGMKTSVYALRPGSHLYEENVGEYVAINVISPHPDPALLSGG